MSEKKIDLIAQLLAKAESTTPEEAQALTEAAARLMTKYMIDEATIAARRAKQGTGKAEQIVQVHHDLVGSYRKALLNVWVSIGSAYGPIKFLKGNDNGKFIRLYVIGFESDVQQFVTLGKSLEIQGAVALRDWWKTNKPLYAGVRSYEQWEARSSFLNGFGRGAASRITDGKAQAVSEAGPGTELVLADRSAAVEEHYDNMAKGKGRSMKYSYDGAAHGAGHTAGRNANTGGRSMTQGRGIGA